MSETKPFPVIPRKVPPLNTSPYAASFVGLSTSLCFKPEVRSVLALNPLRCRSGAFHCCQTRAESRIYRAANCEASTKLRMVMEILRPE